MRRPQGNWLVLRLLRSPLHRVLSRGVVELQYTGRRSGRRFVLPVQYVRDGDRLVLVPQQAETKTWWRNFRTPAPVTVRLARRLVDGTARVVEPDEPGWDEARRRYLGTWHRTAGRVTGPLVVIDLGESPTLRG